MPEPTPKAREYGIYWVKVKGETKWVPGEYCQTYGEHGWIVHREGPLLLNELHLAEIGPRAYSPDEAEENWVASRCALIAEHAGRTWGLDKSLDLAKVIANAIRREFKLTEELPK